MAKFIDIYERLYAFQLLSIAKLGRLCAKYATCIWKHNCITLPVLSIYSCGGYAHIGVSVDFPAICSKTITYKNLVPSKVKKTIVYKMPSTWLDQRVFSIVRSSLIRILCICTRKAENAVWIQHSGKIPQKLAVCYRIEQYFRQGHISAGPYLIKIFVHDLLTIVIVDSSFVGSETIYWWRGFRRAISTDFRYFYCFKFYGSR